MWRLALISHRNNLASPNLLKVSEFHSFLTSIAYFRLAYKEEPELRSCDGAKIVPLKSHREETIEALMIRNYGFTPSLQWKAVNFSKFSYICMDASLVSDLERGLFGSSRHNACRTELLGTIIEHGVTTNA